MQKINKDIKLLSGSISDNSDEDDIKLESTILEISNSAINNYHSR